jgi:hypothetical protein
MIARFPLIAIGTPTATSCYRYLHVKTAIEYFIFEATRFARGHRAKIVSEIAAKKEAFGERVAREVEKVLSHSGQSFAIPRSDREADNRLTVLEKAERLGSRAYARSRMMPLSY